MVAEHISFEKYCTPGEICQLIIQLHIDVFPYSKIHPEVLLSLFDQYINIYQIHLDNPREMMLMAQSGGKLTVQKMKNNNPELVQEVSDHMVLHALLETIFENSFVDRRIELKPM